MKKTKKKKQYLITFVVTDTDDDDPRVLAPLTKEFIRRCILSIGTNDEQYINGVKTSRITVKAWP